MSEQGSSGTGHVCCVCGKPSSMAVSEGEITELVWYCHDCWIAKRKRKEQTATGPYGWVCPVCGRGNAPFNRSCPCKDKITFTCGGSAL